MREEKKHAGGKWETINFIGVALSVLRLTASYASISHNY